jgi:hypothetical protein
MGPGSELNSESLGRVVRRTDRLPQPGRHPAQDEADRIGSELFAVPTFIPPDQPATPPYASESEPVLEGRLPE